MKVISEGLVRITRATIEAAWRRRTPGNRLIIRDKDCRGLALIVNPTAMAWTYAYRPRGTDPESGRRWPNRTVTIGNPASHSPEEARAQANRIKGEVVAGHDPATEKKARAETARRQHGSALGSLLEKYASILPARPKMHGAGLPSTAYTSHELTNVRMALAELQGEDMPAAKLTSEDVRGLLASASGPVAHARFGALSRFLDWCQDAGHIQANPCALIARTRRPKAPHPRAHYLTLEELARLWRAVDGLREPVWRDLSRFLMAMPCRRSEAARLDWSHLDLAAAEWRQPGKLTKNRDPHRLHLHPLALNILYDRHAAAGQPRTGLVFPAPVSGKPVDSFSVLKQTLSEMAALTGWTWHDFRRSFATALGEAGIPETVADSVLNHRQSATRGGVLGVYQRASRWPEQVKAMQLWWRLLAAAIEGRDAGAEVIPLSAAAG